MCMRLPFIPWSIAGVPSSRATSGFPQYCASTCVCFGCTQHASCVDPKPKKIKKATHTHGSTMDPGKPSMSGLELNSNLKDPHSSNLKQGGWCTLLRSRTAEARQAVWSATWDVLQSQAKCERRFRLATVLTVRALIIKGVDRPTIRRNFY